MTLLHLEWVEWVCCPWQDATLLCTVPAKRSALSCLVSTKYSVRIGRFRRGNYWQQHVRLQQAAEVIVLAAVDAATLGEGGRGGSGMCVCVL